MKDKKYLDKVIGSLVRGTKIYYDKDEIHFPSSSSSSLSLLPFSSISLYPHSPTLFSFTKYCKNVYGLTYDEINYVWGEYKNIINDKIENGK